MKSDIALFVIGATALVAHLAISYFQNRKEEKIRKLDEAQFLLYLTWLCYVRPSVKVETITFDVVEPLQEWEWATLEYDLEHKKMFEEWYAAKLAVYEFAPELAKKDASHLMLLVARAPNEKYGDRIMKLLCA